MRQRVLVSWIGHTDLRAMAATLPLSKRKAIAQVIGEAEGEVGPGPVKALLDKETFQEIHLLSNYDPTVTKQYVGWLKQRAVAHQVKFKNPSDHGEILAAVQPVLESLDLKRDDELCFHLSPGTPAMASIWILLGKSQYPATLFQTHWDKVWTTEIPFDITTDLLPKILRDPDRFWQHLATRSPQEVRGFEGILGQSRAIRLAVGRAQRAAIHDVPVLILGESGTGKEMFAEAIHSASHRRNKRFVAINCAAISKDLLESELFGHVKGAFTGAEQDRKGAFEQASGGTLFLDEVGECGLAMQAKLLRALQPPPGTGPCCRVFRRVGATEDTVVDVRIVAATNKDLSKAIAAGEFREDLLYRLSIVTLKLPPLREREGDLGLLAESLLLDINARLRERGDPSYRDKSFSVPAKRFMQLYHWPGNVRELSNALVQAAMMAETAVLGPDDIAAAIAEFPKKKTVEALNCQLGNGFSLTAHLEDIQRHFLRRAMEEAGGKVTKAAKLLGMKSYQTLSAQLDRLQVEYDSEEP
jgi:DNA-binding NtrC family response regulator